MKLVRIKPFDPRKGQLTRRYVVGMFKFEVDHGWYKVEDSIAEYLKGVKTHPTNPLSSFVFDVATEEEAKALSLAEYEAANPERKVSEAIASARVVTKEDLKLEGGGEELEPEAPATEAGSEPADAPSGQEDKGATKGKKKTSPF